MTCLHVDFVQWHERVMNWLFKRCIKILRLCLKSNSWNKNKNKNYVLKFCPLHENCTNIDSAKLVYFFTLHFLSKKPENFVIQCCWNRSYNKKLTSCFTFCVTVYRVYACTKECGLSCLDFETDVILIFWSKDLILNIFS